MGLKVGSLGHQQHKQHPLEWVIKRKSGVLLRSTSQIWGWAQQSVTYQDPRDAEASLWFRTSRVGHSHPPFPTVNICSKWA